MRSLKRFTLAALVAALTLALPATSASAATLSIVPALQAADVGGTFSLGISIADVADLFDYQFDLTFDPTIIRADVVSDGGFLTSAGGQSVFAFLGLGAPFVLTLDNTLGLITIADSLLGPAPPATGVTGSGLLATITFAAIAAGTTDIGLANPILEDSLGNAIAADLVGGRVVVTEGIPEPSTLLLVACAVAMIYCSRKGR